MKTLMFSAIAAFASVGAFADATIDRVLVRQQWPWNEKVAIDFVLTNVTAATQIGCTVYRGETPVADSTGASAAAFSGDIYNLTADGAYRITFDPSCLANRPAKGETLRFALTPSAGESTYGEVLYKIFDLENGTVTDVTRGALLNGEYGSVETDYSRIGEGYSTPLSDVLVWTGVTNYPGAKTTKLVMRKVPAGAAKWGIYNNWIQSQVVISVTKPFYIGVFELTQKQYEYFRDKTGTDTYNPGEISCNLGDDKPVQNIAVLKEIFNDNRNRWDSETGALKKLKDLFANNGQGTYCFDLPTQAMWLRAMRAGITENTYDPYYYDGISSGNTPDDPGIYTYNDRMAVLGRFAGNGGIVDNGDGTATTNGVAVVGSYRPNAFGLYDMIGNVAEANKDDYTSWGANQTDPCGTLTGNGFGTLGGHWSTSAKLPYQDNRSYNLHSSFKQPFIGVRLAFFEDENPYNPAE